MIECPGCGNNLIYDIVRQKMYCNACGCMYEPERMDKKKDADSTEMEINRFVCPQCAGEIYSTDDAVTAFCSYCGAATMLTSRLQNERRPDYVIPFKVTKERCKEVYAEAMKKAIYAPRRLRDKKNIQEFRGIYIPYWLCEVEQNGPVRVKVTKSYREGNYDIVDTYAVDTHFENRYEGIAMDASSLFPDDINNKIAPFDAIGMKEFSTGYLSGFYADLPDVDYKIYEDRVYEVTDTQVYGELEARLQKGKNTVKIKEPEQPLSTMFHSKLTGVKTGLFPVWFMSYKNGKRIAYATVNGQSGKVVADIPMDIKRFLIGCVIGTIPLYFLLELFLTLRPIVLLPIVMLIGAFVSVLHALAMKKVADVDSHKMDEGFSARHSLNRRLEQERLQQERAEADREQYGEKAVDLSEDEPIVITSKKASGKKKDPAKMKRELKQDAKWLGIQMIPFVLFFLCGRIFMGNAGTPLFNGEMEKAAGYVMTGIAIIILCWAIYYELKNTNRLRVGGWLSAVGIVIATIILILRPVQDQFYYGGVMFVGVMIVMTLIDVVLSYNQLATRPLPQFEYKGGDDRA